MDLIEIFHEVYTFMQSFEPFWAKRQLENGKSRRGRIAQMTIAEILTIIIFFHASGFRTFKEFYKHISVHCRQDFPDLVSYSRFVTIMKTALIPLLAYLLFARAGKKTGIAFIDSTPIEVCRNIRRKRNRVFKGFAKSGRTSMGWFFGFKLHLIVNDIGEILAFTVTPGNTHDLSVANFLSQDIVGKLFGDKGYISKRLAEQCMQRGLKMVTGLKKNMKNKLMDSTDKVLLRKRAIIETINDQLKNIMQIEHTRHRSVSNFLVNLLGGLAAYSHQAKKPSIRVPKELFGKLLMAA